MFHRRLLVSCLLSFAISTRAIGQDASPLSNDELRETAENLIEGLANRERVAAQAEILRQMEALAERTEAVHLKELEAEQRLRAIAERERDEERRRGDELDRLLTAVTRKPGFGCVLKKVFTLGLARC